MKHHGRFLGIVALFCLACGNDPPPAIDIGSGGGNSGGGGSGGAGGEAPIGPEGFVFPGTLALEPMAVTDDGQVWLFSGDYSSMGPGYPGIWQSARLRKIDAQNAIAIDDQIDADGFDVEPIAVHASANGDVFLLGHTSRAPGSSPSLPIGGQTVPITFAQSAFVAKLDSQGKLLWANVLNGDAGLDANGSPGLFRLADVGTDQTGRVYIAAILRGTADLGAGSVTHDDALMFVLSPEGKHVEQRLLSSKDTAFLDLDVEPSGALWLARSSLFLTAGIEHFDATGKTTYSAWEPVCWVEGLGFAPDTQGGFFSVRTEDVAEHCTSLTMQHVLASGQQQWLVNDGMYYALRPALARSGAGRALLGIGLEGTIALGNSSMTGTDRDDIWLAEFDTLGNISKTQRFGGPGIDEIVRIGVDAKGNRFVTGYFAEQIQFGAEPLKNTVGASRAIFLARIAP